LYSGFDWKHNRYMRANSDSTPKDCEYEEAKSGPDVLAEQLGCAW
jgi:hypothetical protein